MPTATSFTALGRGNGFSFCPAKVDVSGYDNWVTLGGVSSGSATQAQINTSLVNAMKLYWNLYSATASFTATWTDGNLSFDKSLANHQYVITPEPRRRLCEGITQPAQSSTGMTEAEYDQTGGVGCGTFGSFKIFHPVRMYNGSTSNTSNFVGYGIRDLFNGSALGDHLEGVASVNATVKVSSYLNGTTGSGSNESPVGSGNFSYFDRTASILNLSGIPFRSFSSAGALTNANSAFSKTLSSSANSASASGTSSGTGYSNSVSGSVTIPTNFGFDFYTYS
tara:strand:+ start:114 stop:953 length:840 start_codon:yes stop_codon:yes gene_type:complete